MKKINKDMFPFMFLGVGIASWWSSLFAPKVVEQLGNNLIMVNKVNDNVFKALAEFVKIYEGFDSKAYNLGDGKITIGYGTTQWLNPNGSVSRPVRMGDTITEIVAEQQLKYYFVKVIPQLNFYLESNSFSVSHLFLASLLNFTYMSGSGFLNWNSTKSLIAKVNGNQILPSVAYDLKTDMILAYKSLKTNPTEKARYGSNKFFKWQIYGTGWSRRIQASADLIEGKMKPKKWYESTIKKAF